MKSEGEPIADDEWLLRIIHVQYWKTDQFPIMSLKAFEPRDGRHPDLDGISLYREACLNNPEDCLIPIAEGKRSQNGVVRLSAGLIRSLGFTILAKPTGIVLGHAVIPELNLTAFKMNRGLFSPLLKRLAEEASSNIVKVPI